MKVVFVILSTAVGTDRIEWQRFLKLCEYYHIDLDKPLKDFDEEERDIILLVHMILLLIQLFLLLVMFLRTTNYIEGVVTLIQRRYEETSSKWSKEWYASFMAEHTCPTCHGARLNEMVLSVQVGGLNIIEFTNLSIEKALEFVENLKLSEMEEKIAHLILKEIHDRLTFLNEVGLGYLTLSRRAGGLSGGEAQRIKLATELSKRSTGKTIYILDEPTTGLHFADVHKLVDILHKLTEGGNTVVVIEHNLDVIKTADYIIDMGPEGGDRGGTVIAKGTPEEVAKVKKSYTGQYVKKYLETE